MGSLSERLAEVETFFEKLEQDMNHDREVTAEWCDNNQAIGGGGGGAPRDCFYLALERYGLVYLRVRIERIAEELPLKLRANAASGLIPVPRMVLIEGVLSKWIHLPTLPCKGGILLGENHQGGDKICPKCIYK